MVHQGNNRLETTYAMNLIFSRIKFFLVEKVNDKAFFFLKDTLGSFIPLLFLPLFSVFLPISLIICYVI